MRDNTNPRGVRSLEEFMNVVAANTNWGVVNAQQAFLRDFFARESGEREPVSEKKFEQLTLNVGAIYQQDRRRRDMINVIKYEAEQKKEPPAISAELLTVPTITVPVPPREARPAKPSVVRHILVKSTGRMHIFHHLHYTAKRVWYLTVRNKVITWRRRKRRRHRGRRRG